MIGTGCRRVVLATTCVLLAVGSVASAQDLGALDRDVRQLEQRVTALPSLVHAGPVRRAIPPYTERFADAELLYRLHDYARASVLFTDIVTNYSDSPAYSNSLFLLGESLYQAGDRMGARTRFLELVARANEPLFRPYAQRALGRLIEIALRTGDLSRIEEVFAQLNQLPPAEVEAQTSYVRGKYFFLRAQPDYEQARQAFEQVPQRAPVYAQARYFLGAILTAQGRYAEAIDAFQRLQRLQAESTEQQQVLDLAALAIGRLEIERDNYDAAVTAYQLVARSSPHFDRALYEQAWALVRSGDAVRAERTLEILSVSNPDSPLIPEGRLLWGNLLLRTGRFDRARQVFQTVRDQFGPINSQLERLMAEHTNPELYFHQLVMSNINVFDSSSFVPSAALQWFRSEGTLDRALAVVSDLNLCRQYIRESEDLVSRLNAAISAPSRAHVFIDLRNAREQVYEVLNRVTQLRHQVARGMDRSIVTSEVNLVGLVNERQGLDASVQRLPVTDAQIRRRDRAAEDQFSLLGQQLQRADVQVAYLEAMIVAIDHFVADPAGRRSGVNLEALQAELERHRTAVQRYRSEIVELRRLINAGRSQVGAGDPRYEHDREIGDRLRELVRLEQLGLANRVPGDVAELLRRLDTAEARTLEIDSAILEGVDRRLGVIREQIRDEETRVAGYRSRLAQLESDAADVVGHLIMENFASVRLHFYRIVMRADLGIVDVAWEIREEHNTRARNLAEDENRQIAAYNDEFTEILEGSSPAPPAASARGPSAAAASGGAGSSSSPAPATPAGSIP